MTSLVLVSIILAGVIVPLILAKVYYEHKHSGENQ